jgi:hypothetical protein
MGIRRLAEGKRDNAYREGMKVGITSPVGM